MHGIIPAEHLRCWLLFVQACSLQGKRILKKQDVITAGMYFEHFYKNFERIYGVHSCTPNMHLHLHLTKCLLDFGSPHSTWCFAFERFNGLLGSYHTNRKSVEGQIMKSFLMHQVLKSSYSSLDSEIIKCFSQNVLTKFQVPAALQLDQYLHRIHCPVGEFNLSLDFFRC